MRSKPLAGQPVGGRPARARAVARGAGLYRSQARGDAASGIEDTADRLAALERDHVVQSHSPRYTIAGEPGQALLSGVGHEEDAERDEAGRARLVTAISSLADLPSDDPSRQGEAELLLALARDAVDRNATGEVLALAHAADTVLGPQRALGSMGARARCGAARRATARSEAEEAWARHQLGSRALGLGESAVAAAQLGRALQLRESIGDRAGAAVTRHNLDLLSGPPLRQRWPAYGTAAYGCRWSALARSCSRSLAGVGLATGLSNGGGSHAVTTLAPAKATTPPSSHGPSSSRSPAQSPGATQPPTGTPGTGPPKPPIVSLPASVVVPMSPGGNRLVQGSADPPLTKPDPARDGHGGRRPGHGLYRQSQLSEVSPPGREVHSTYRCLGDRRGASRRRRHSRSVLRVARAPRRP